MNGWARSLCATFALACLFSAANAATVKLDGSKAVAVLGLDVSGQLYNVTFQTGTFDDVYQPELFPFLFPFGDLAGATEARDKLVALLNDSPALSVGDSNEAWIVYQQVAGSGGGVENRAVGPIYQSGEWQGSDFAGSPGDPSINYALFSAVPIPAAAYLFASALGLLSVVRRRSAADRLHGCNQVFRHIP
ncbi:MAG: hypothetical protein JSV45_14280 [Chromatiales bacterium]|nr:MAG: hypothetical protein JSV45_14280 [Chromatiales bacterium]